jgi:hypothetical protein
MSDAVFAETVIAIWASRRGASSSPPWRSRNVRLEAPDGTQLTLFTVLD